MMVSIGFQPGTSWMAIRLGLHRGIASHFQRLFLVFKARIFEVKKNVVPQNSLIICFYWII
jgi:hypothetical protein